jgi:cytoskeleton protein RodZ
VHRKEERRPHRGDVVCRPIAQPLSGQRRGQIRRHGDRPATAGALLAAAREAAGLSIDAVAQQLKLAPRQVRALEEGDYMHLPGRTFVRGFARNYARLVRLDPETVVGALAEGSTGSSLAAPTLHPTAPTIGELPTSDHAKPGWTRWAIPVTLAAIVAAAAVYEWLRPAGDGHLAGGTVTPGAPATSTAPPTSAPAPTTPAHPAPPAGVPDRSAVPLASPQATGTSGPEPAPVPAPVTVPAPAPIAADAPAPGPAAAAPADDQPLTLSFRDYSWTEVRDRDGRVLLSGMNRGGTTQSLAGTPPLDLVIGNAADVSVTYRGQPVDLNAYTRQNVARFTLP